MRYFSDEGEREEIRLGEETLEGSFFFARSSRQTLFF